MKTLDYVKKPSWIKSDIPFGKSYRFIKELNKRLNLNTVCEEAACPNLGECWDRREATYMILGKNCTRKCRFCNVTSDEPDVVDNGEPANIAYAIKELGLKYVVITSVTRDDLPDKGLGHYLTTVEEIKTISPDTKIELLIPDFDAREELVYKIANCEAGVIGHNIEMVKRLYKDIRPNSNYDNSLEVLRLLKKTNPDIVTKSAIMVGLGETKEELNFAFKDIADSGVKILHIGQYLQPSFRHVSVKRYYTPEEFQKLEGIAKGFGIKSVKSGPMVRSSYKAEESYMKVAKCC